jgi:FemAB-related protein (PEP-CTERM system-associated)
MGITIVDVDKSNIDFWKKYINKRVDSTFVDTIEWKTIIEKVYGLHSYWYLAERNGIVEGILALTLANHPIFGKYLATAPFGSVGGFYYDTKEAGEVLLKRAEELNRKLRTKYVLIRKYNDAGNPPSGWVNDPIYSSYMVNITDHTDNYYRNTLSRKTRACIRDSKRKGLFSRFGHFELLDDFWFVILRAMKELGSPYHSRAYLESILKIFGDKVSVNVLYTRDKLPCAAGLSIFHNDQVDFVYGPILNKYRSLNIGEYLYWSIIDENFKKGYRKINLGRSLDGSGNEQFKLKWRPSVHKMANWYYFSGNTKFPGLNQYNKKLKPAVALWSHLPVWFHELMGPYFISGVI